LHITDPHLHAHVDSRMRGVNTYDTFRAVITHSMGESSSPDAIIATGDLVQDETKTGYKRFREVLEYYQLPVYCIPGNHDSPETMAEVLNKPPFQVGGSAQLGDWSLILLNSFSSGDDGGRLSTKELARLRKALAANESSYAMIFIHHHPVSMGSRWLDGVGLRNSHDFFDIVEQSSQVRGIVWGHVHQASDRRRKGVRLMSTPSTCSQFLPNSDDFALDTRLPGYRWLELRSNGTIDTQVVWLEKI
jgi:Icc protein